MPNRLADAASPYLRSHASNPVDWWQWGPEPFAEAAARDVPVLVSIGYSTCHWCHVMARESFSDPAVAALMNDNLVAIKVDREEHAEVDTTYLAAAAAFTPNLGWPLNVFVTPQGHAFFAGTYWPPRPVAGHASFRQVLDAVLEAWRERRAEVEAGGEAIASALSARRPVEASPLPDLDAVRTRLESLEDTEFGGFSTAPKFPVAPVLRFLDGTPLGERTLDAMAASPLCDGGFFRYATRRDWGEPHYERMLYDNAQLLASFALAGRAEVAEGIAGFLLETLRLPGGAFASAQDSESVIDGRRVEGGWYLLDAAARAAHDAPAVDAKVLTGWNGLAIEGLALAGTVLERADWVAAARTAADWLLEHHVGARLVRVSVAGTPSAAPATLEDFGMLATGLLQLATATGELRYATAARALVDACLGGDPFAAPGGGDPVLAAQGVAGDEERSDSALPSGWSALAAACERLWSFTAQPRYRDAALRALGAVASDAAQHPLSFGAALSVMRRLESGRQLVVVDDAGDSDVASLARRLAGSVVTSAQAHAFAAAGFELYAGRTTSDGRATAYLCEDFVCRLPVTDAAALAALVTG
jgi:hypothetical protein